MNEFEDHMISIVCHTVQGGQYETTLEELWINASILIYGDRDHGTFIQEEVERRLGCESTNGN